MTININLTGMDLAAAGKEGVTALVNACTAFAGASLGTEIEMSDKPHKITSGDGIIVPDKVYTDEPVPRAEPAAALPQPVKAIASAPQRDAAPAPTPQSVTPAAPQPATAAAPPAAPPVPTAPAPEYTIEELQTACAPLMDANNMEALRGVLAKYGAASLYDIPAEQRGALAADLRALGARL